jgi:hypothetical protein
VTEDPVDAVLRNGGKEDELTTLPDTSFVGDPVGTTVVMDSG